MVPLSAVLARLTSAGTWAESPEGESRLAERARASGVAVVGSPWGPCVTDGDAAALYRSITAEHDATERAAQAAFAAAPQSPPASPAEDSAGLIRRYGPEAGLRLAQRQHLGQVRVVSQAELDEEHARAWSHLPGVAYREPAPQSLPPPPPAPPRIPAWWGEQDASDPVQGWADGRPVTP